MNPATHREQLEGMLCEAAEIEHCLMCTYLYAAFSLKQNEGEDLNAEELAAVRRWRAEIIRIATDEMLHLALVNNLLIALGAKPHYRRFNFPIGAGLFPADVAVSLRPFDEATLDHFVYLERPMGAAERDGIQFEFEKSQFRRSVIADRLMPFADDYTTVGELYLGIEASFAKLIDQSGAQSVFLGPIDAQLTMKDFRLQGLCTVASMRDVQGAITLIREQGEGSTDGAGHCHYSRFCAMREEWQALKAARPAFVPARPVAANPVMRSPVAKDRIQITAEPASQLLDVANAAYGMMLRQLQLMSDASICPPSVRARVGEQTLELMHLVAEVGSFLTTLPAQTDLAGVNAGITFTVSRSALAFQSSDSAAAIMAERYHAIAMRLGSLSTAMPTLKRYSAALEGSANFWRECAVKALAAKSAVGGATLNNQAAPTMPIAVVPAPTVPVANQPASVGSDQVAALKTTVDSARGEAIEVRFDTARCIHSRHCVLDEPKVFIANKPGEWIYPDAATPERLAMVAWNCPSGAITYTRLDGGANEPAPLVNVLRVRENGPLALHAALTIDGAPEFRATLCRCGKSNNKPYCDSSHIAALFSASGEPATRNTQALDTRDGELQVTPLRNGPLEVKGNLEMCAGTGRIIDRFTSARLCRCGHSKDKPFCDSSHIEAGFEATGA